MSRRVSRAAIAAALAASTSIAATLAFAQERPPAPPIVPPAPQEPDVRPGPAPTPPAPPAPAAPTAPVPPVQAAIDIWLEGIEADPAMRTGYDSFTVTGDRAVITGLSIVSSATREGVEFGTITLTGFETEGDSGFSFDELTIDRVEAVGGDSEVQIRMQAIRIEDLLVPATGFAIDPDKPFTSAIELFGMVADTEVGEAVFGRIDITQDQGGLNSVTTYHNYTLTGWHDGRIDTVSAGPIVLDAPSPDGLFSMTVASVESRGTDLDAIPYIFDIGRYENGVGKEEWRTAVESASYSNIVVTAPGLQMRIRGIELEDFRLRQSDRPVADLLDRLIANGSRPDAQLEEMAGEAVVDFLMPYGIGRFAIDGIDVYAEGLDRFHLGEFHLNDLSLDGLGEIGFSDLDIIISGEGNAQVEQFAVGGIEMPSRDLIREAIRTGIADEDFADIAALVPRFAYVQVGGVSIGEHGQLPITLGRFQVDWGGYVGPVPTSYRVELEDFGAPLSLLSDDMRRILGQLGYTEATADFAFDATWDEKASTLSINDVVLTLEGAGSVRANFQLGGITREALEDQSNLDPSQITLIGAQLEVTDETVAERLFAWTAEGTNQPAEQYREEFIRGLPFLMSVMMDRELAARLAPPIQEFLRQPGTMTVTLAPPQPVGMDQLNDVDPNDVGALVDLLGVTIETVPH